MTAVNQEFYEFYVKLAYTTETKNYRFNPNMTITEFISDLKNRATHDFNIVNSDDIEVVEAGRQEDEMAPKLEPCNQPLRYVYGNRNQFVAFYIRLRNNNNTNTNTSDQVASIEIPLTDNPVVNNVVVENDSPSQTTPTNNCCLPFYG